MYRGTQLHASTKAKNTVGTWIIITGMLICGLMLIFSYAEAADEMKQQEELKICDIYEDDEDSEPIGCITMKDDVITIDVDDNIKVKIVDGEVLVEESTEE